MSAYTCYNDHHYDADQIQFTVNQCPAVPPGGIAIQFPVSFGTSPPLGTIGRLAQSGFASVGVVAYCSDGYWKLKLAHATQNLIVHANLAQEGISQITTSAINSASCSLLNTMKSSILHYASSHAPTFVGGYYDRDAVRNHELVHRDDFVVAANSLYALLRNELETSPDFRRPLSAAATATAARNLMIASVNARVNSFSFDLGVTLNNLGHSQPQRFIDIQMATVDPFIAQINTRLVSCS